MDESIAQDLNDSNEINDEQERLHFLLSLKWDKERIFPQKVKEQFHELKILQLLLYFLITSGIVSFFILVLINIHLIIIMIDVGVVVVYIFYLKYITHKYRKILKISKKEYKLFIKIKKDVERLSLLQLIFYSFMVIITISVLILSMIGIDLLVIITIIMVSILFIYLDNENGDN